MTRADRRAARLLASLLLALSLAGIALLLALGDGSHGLALVLTAGAAIVALATLNPPSRRLGS